MAFELPKLAYAYDALEPHIDARTMETTTPSITTRMLRT
jgi:superoxide dismutase